MIDYISFFVVAFLTILVIMNCFKNITKEETKFSFKLLVVLVLGSFITTLLLYFNNFFLKNIFTLSFFVLVFRLNSKKTIKELFYYAALIWLYGLFLDFLVMIIISISGVANLLNNVNIIYIKTASSLLMLLLIYLFCSIKYIKNFTNKTVLKLIKIKSSHIIEFGFVIALIILSVLCAANINKLSVMTLYSFIASLIIFLIFQIIIKKYNIKKLSDLNKILVKNNEFFIKLDTDYRILKHNLTSQLLGIKSVADVKTKSLIDELIESYNSKFVASQDINKIPEGINGIVYEKVYSYNNPNIKLAVENNMKSNLLETLRPRVFNNMCETLGVLVDNALEAASKSHEKSILIDFSEEKEYIHINISNTFDDIIDIDKLGEKDYSTKGNLRGIGLFSLFRKNDVKLKNKIINNLFIVEIKVKKSIL
ncbi:MAG: GHKL domain-containing protein [Bacilli bacterium]|nr:GHKL domain-containing protein [Bacilli bacterium]